MNPEGNTLQTLKGFEAKVTELNSSGMLPAGYKVVPYYDRTTTTSSVSFLPTIPSGYRSNYVVTPVQNGHLAGKQWSSGERPAIDAKGGDPRRQGRGPHSEQLRGTARSRDLPVGLLQGVYNGLPFQPL